MTQQLTVLFLEQNNQARPLGTLSGERVSIGRECPGGITVEVAGVSRIHGEFVRVRSQYLFADLGSTNGSWINGKKIDSMRPMVMRAGDTLQLAAAPLKIGSGGGIKSEVPSLLVLRLVAPTVPSEDNPQAEVLSSIEEFPIPAAGVVMTVGGPQSDVDDCGPEPVARVLKEDGGLTLELISGDALLNGLRPAAKRVPIGDNDIISVGAVRVVVNIPPRLTSGQAVRSPGVFGSGMGGLGSQEKREVDQTTVFAPGSLDDHINPEATTAIFDSRSLRDTQNLATGDLHPNRRFGESADAGANSLGLSPLEVKLVIVMAIMLFASVFLLGLWWFSQNR